MYKVHLFQNISQFNTVFKVNPGNQVPHSLFLVMHFVVSNLEGRLGCN
jgi:hypothetical protein